MREVKRRQIFIGDKPVSETFEQGRGPSHSGGGGACGTAGVCPPPSCGWSPSPRRARGGIKLSLDAAPHARYPRGHVCRYHNRPQGREPRPDCRISDADAEAPGARAQQYPRLDRATGGGRYVGVAPIDRRDPQHARACARTWSPRAIIRDASSRRMRRRPSMASSPCRRWSNERALPIWASRSCATASARATSRRAKWPTRSIGNVVSRARRSTRSSSRRPNMPSPRPRRPMRDRAAGETRSRLPACRSA